MPNSSRFAVAVHVLTLMAWERDEPLKSDYVAESVNTNPVVIRRILSDLARAGLVVSQTGGSGGSRLARNPQDISLLDVYRAVEDRGVFALPRQPANRDCPVGMNIETVLGTVLEHANSALEREMSGMTIEDLLRRLKRCDVRQKKRKTRC